MSAHEAPTPQLLHLVFGGELKALDGTEFRDPGKLDVVGIYASYAEAQMAWTGKAQASVDNALMRYYVVHLHRLLDPGAALASPGAALASPGAALKAAGRQP